jgi:transcriptional regulator with XRE-family HTH domain
MTTSDSTYSIYVPSIYPAEDRSIAGYMVILPLYVALIAGTGGAYAASNVQLANEFVSHPIINIVDSRGSRDAKLSFASQILRIREVFGLNMSELACVFGITRPTAYAWINGAEPRPELVDKMWMLSSWANDFEQLGIANLSSYLRRPLVNGRHLLGLLTTGEDLNLAASKIREFVSSDKAAVNLMRNRGRRNQNASSILDISSVITELE